MGGFERANSVMVAAAPTFSEFIYHVFKLIGQHKLKKRDDKSLIGSPHLPHFQPAPQHELHLCQQQRSAARIFLALAGGAAEEEQGSELGG